MDKSLSEVTGLLLSYRFSSALSRWDEGKKVWVALRSDIRDGIRMVRPPIYSHERERADEIVVYAN